MNTPYPDQPDLHINAPYRAALLTYPSNLQQALQDSLDDPKKTLFGVAHGIPSVYLTKVLASTKPDFIWIDVEHGMFNRLELYDAIQAVQHHSEGKTFAIVRSHAGDETSLTTALDAGAAGIVIPHCESAQEVEEMYKKINYPPNGVRSFCPWIFTPGISDASLYSNDPNNMVLANRHIVLIPQIETVKGLENMEEIAAAPGVSALMFGRNDFAADAGIPSSNTAPPHPELIKALDKFATIGRKYNKPLLGGAYDINSVPKLIEDGYRIICVLFDNWGIAQLLNGLVKKGKELAEESNK